MTKIQLLSLCKTFQPYVASIYWATREGNTQSRITFHLHQKKTKWWMELPEGFARLIPLSTGPIFGKGRIILGCLANRLWSPLILVGTQNYCVGSKHLQIDQLIFAPCGKHTTNYFVSLGIFMHQGNRTQR